MLAILDKKKESTTNTVRYYSNYINLSFQTERALITN